MIGAEERGPWNFGDLDGYIREGEPEQAQRAENWQVAIGLQAVDGLITSPYLLETAREHIEGRIDIGEAQRRILSYYDELAERETAEGDREADVVSSNIAKLLGERTFTFSPTELCGIHRRLFDQVLPRAGKYRTYNITKQEWVLKGGTVYYASYDTIAETLRYEFAQEREFSYAGLTASEVVAHFVRFISGIWQIHPFSEGNTRTTAVFAIKYLRTMGYDLDNEPFKEHSWYFRNALVRANYEDVSHGIARNSVYLERFFENQLIGTHHELKNRYLHLDWGKWQATTHEDGELAWKSQRKAQQTQQVTKQRTTQENTGATQDTTREPKTTTQEKLLALLKNDPTMTAQQLADELGISFDGVRYHLAQLRKAGVIRHEGPTKKGRWVIDEQD